MKITGGFVLSARKTLESEIWISKPAWWFKVWSYILMRVNYTEKSKFKPGENRFSYGMIYENCYLVNEGVADDSIKNVLKFLKNANMVTVRRTTRGIIIKVLNWEVYQDLESYRNRTGNRMGNQTRTGQEPDRNRTINNKGKNDKKGEGGKPPPPIPSDCEYQTPAENLPGGVYKHIYDARKSPVLKLIKKDPEGLERLEKDGCLVRY